MEAAEASSGRRTMFPPPPGTFRDRDDLISHVRDFGANQGYVVTIKKSRKDKWVLLGCDRGGVYRSRRQIGEIKRKRKAGSRLINCPFEAIGKKDDNVWVLTLKNGEHNHEPLNDMTEHPYSRRFTEEEVKVIKELTDAGKKPRQVLKALKQINPQLQSTPRHLYNLKAKIRQGNFSERSFKTWRPMVSNPIESFPAEGSSSDSNHLLKVCNFVGGKFVNSHGCFVSNVVNPATLEVVSEVPSTSYEELNDAVNAAKQAFSSWKNTRISDRQRIMLKLHGLICRDIDKLAVMINTEQGMPMKGARVNILHGLEIIEQACGCLGWQAGEYIPNANGADTYSMKEPLGVCAGICHSSCSAIVPLWMFPIAVACGNTFVLKPPEKNPGVSMKIAELTVEAGLPNGVLNFVHGGNDVVNHICDNDDIGAVSFIGSTTTAMLVHSRATSRGKRVQANMGSKDYAIVMPDAFMDSTLDGLIAAGFCSAKRPFTSPFTVIFVEGSAAWEEDLVKRAKALKINGGTDPGADIGPVTGKEVKDRVCLSVQGGVQSGARLILDGRYIVVPGYEMGSFVGPTILCDVTTSMDCYKEEIFGPVLLCLKASSLEEAITIVNRNKFCHGASIFTASAVAARKFQNEIDTGLVGVNVPVPSGLPFSSASFAGDLNYCGKSAVQFYTKTKTVAQQWRDLPMGGASFRDGSLATPMNRNIPLAEFSKPSRDHGDLPRPALAPSPVVLSDSLSQMNPSLDPATTSLATAPAKYAAPSQGLSLASSQDWVNTFSMAVLGEATTSTSQQAEINSDPMYQRIETSDPPIERVYMPALPHRNDSLVPVLPHPSSSQENGAHSTSQDVGTRVYMGIPPQSQKNKSTDVGMSMPPAGSQGGNHHMCVGADKLYVPGSLARSNSMIYDRDLDVVGVAGEYSQ